MTAHDLQSRIHTAPGDNTSMELATAGQQQQEQQQRGRIFIGLFPCGISYADRQREKHRDYARLAFLPYDTLHLQLEHDCPPELVAEIEAHASTIQARRGEPFQVGAPGQTVILGRVDPVDRAFAALK